MFCNIINEETNRLYTYDYCCCNGEKIGKENCPVRDKCEDIIMLPDEGEIETCTHITKK